MANHPGLFIAPHADALTLAAAHRNVCGENNAGDAVVLSDKKRLAKMSSHFTLSATSALAPVPALLVAWQT